MATTDIDDATIDRVYPTELDVADTDYNGVNGHEVNVADSLHWRAPNNCVLADLSGGGFPLETAGWNVQSGVGLNITVSRGRAFISGRRIEMLAGANFDVGIDDEKDNFIYLTLNVTGIVQQTPALKITVSPVAIGAGNPIPVNSTLLAVVTATGGAITNVEDYRTPQERLPLRLNLDHTGTPDVSLRPNYTRIYVPQKTIYLCGFFNCFNLVNNNSIDLDYEVDVIGPFGSTLHSFNGVTVPNTDSLQFYNSLKILDSIGRYKGGYIELVLQNVVKVSGVGDANVSTIQNKLLHVQDIASSWALKSWASAN